jgi:hypothetical protein
MNDESTDPTSPPLESTPSVSEKVGEAPPPVQTAPEATEPAIEPEVWVTLRSLGLRWAELGLGSSKVLLQRGARVLDDAAERVGLLQERVQRAMPAR